MLRNFVQMNIGNRIVPDLNSSPTGDDLDIFNTISEIIEYFQNKAKSSQINDNFKRKKSYKAFLSVVTVSAVCANFAHTELSVQMLRKSRNEIVPNWGRIGCL